ncbi:MAG: GAF domain-containing protein, partial [Actinobacteria bacterium]|nr:GAF domain-containing protein [Actinomycetota bacterium]
MNQIGDAGGAPEGLERALESLRGESEVAQALLGLSAALAEVRSVSETLELMVAQVPPLFGAGRGFAASLDRAGATLGISAMAGYDDALEGILLHPSGQSGLLAPLRSAVGGREPVFLRGDDPGLAVLRPVHELEALLVLPLARAGVDFGVLAIEFTEPRRFDSMDLALARGVVHQCAVALTNARQLDLLRGLREFGLRIGRRLRLRGVAEDITHGAAKLLEADAALLYFADPAATRLAPSKLVPVPSWLPPSLGRLDLTAPPWSRLIRGESLSSTEVASAEGMTGSELSVLAAPILTGRSPILGAVVVVFRGPRTLRREDGEALNVLGAQAGMAITNARRFERQRRVARHLQAG